MSTAYQPIGPGPNFTSNMIEIAKAVAQYKEDILRGIRSPHDRRASDIRFDSPPLSDIGEIHEVAQVACGGLEFAKEKAEPEATRDMFNTVLGDMSGFRSGVRAAQPPFQISRRDFKKYRNDISKFLSEKCGGHAKTNREICRMALSAFWRSAARHILGLEAEGHRNENFRALLVAIEAIILVGPLELTRLEYSTMAMLQSFENVLENMRFPSARDMRLGAAEFAEVIETSRPGLLMKIAEAEARLRASASLGRHFQHGTLTERRAAMYGSVAPNISVSPY